MAQYDLTSEVGKYLDRHLVFPLLEFLSAKEIYDEREMLQAKVELLSSTQMVDFAMDVYSQLHPDTNPPESMVDKRSKVVQRLKELQEATSHVVAVLADTETQHRISTIREQSQLVEMLEKEFNIKPDSFVDLYELAKFRYECGNYQGSAEVLEIFRQLIPPTDENMLNTLWGKLASEILMQNWDVALEEITKLAEHIDNHISVTAPLEVLQQRSWLIHWSLFVYFNHPKGCDGLIDLFLRNQSYLNAIQTMCPHILRYLTTAIITSHRSRPDGTAILKDLVKVIRQESYSYSDPITEFVEALYVSFDFDGAREKLVECEQVLEHDFFLVACQETFVENARLLIFEIFCRIHQCISIDKLAQKLNMTPERAEQWIVDLIRNAHLNAKIDSEKGHVVMAAPTPSVYEQVIEKTKGLSVRAQSVMQATEKKGYR
ncbi:eukaryotic translation initiation factor 3 subunit E-like [Sycon ciliatum]|uniref:eukaryotic translation initiation factor 3 subunit E-like n=1 Tax=Sycon ciliatum TaxID=27933 RepID=UPI0020A9A34B|eukprot:scpid78346/ scgid32860/ Eukaryotic translation initiation factor 3 subunit E; Eukaryotic translation initiation factor 3 subunit 6